MSHALTLLTPPADLGHRPYPCDACGRGFARSDLLKRHLTTCATIKQQHALGSAAMASVNAAASASASGSGSPSGSTSDASPSQPSPPGATPNAYPPISIPRAGVTGSQVGVPGVYDSFGIGTGLGQGPSPPQAHAQMSATELVSSLPAYSYPTNSSASTSPSLFSASDGSPQTGESSVENSPEYAGFLGMGASGGQSASSLTSDAAKLIGAGGSFAGADAQTLAPTLSTSDPWKGFAPAKTPPSDLTAGEIEASEVLEKLLRSPRLSPNPAQAGQAYNMELANSYFGQAWDPSAPVDASAQALMAGYTPGELGAPMAGTSLWDDPALNIEFSQESQLLAEYFNSGGIGGITALDLGFPVQPASLYPEHLFQPREVHDARLHIPNEKFCMGFLYPWKDSMPEVEQMNEYAITATQRLLPNVPVMHEPTLRFTDMSNHAVFALSVAGGAYDVGNKGEQFSGTMLSLKRVYIVKSFNRPENTDEDRFQHLQSMLLYQLTGFYRNQEHRDLSHAFHGALVQMSRQLNLVDVIRKAKVPEMHAGLSGAELDSAWKAWVALETKRRVAFIVYLLDVELASHYKTPPVLSFSELDIDLPSAECLWKARDAQEFQRIKSSPVLRPPTHFLSAIRALMASATCSPFSEDGTILNELPALDPLSLLILSRTLSFLQVKAEETIAQSDPFRSMLGGLMGGAAGREQEESRDHEVLRHIKAARAHLQMMPGGAKRGGGESWFEEVMPQSSDESRKKARADEVLTPAVLRAVRMDMDDLAEQYPDFVKKAGRL